MVKVKKKGTQLRGEGAVKLVAEYQQIRKMREMWGKKEADIKKQLETIVEEKGEVDDKGHVWYELPEEVGGVTKLYRQKRVSQNMDEGIAEVHLKKLGLWDECSTKVVVIDEDAVLAMGFQDRIPAEIMQEIITERVSYAFYLK